VLYTTRYSITIIGLEILFVREIRDLELLVDFDFLHGIVVRERVVAVVIIAAASAAATTRRAVPDLAHRTGETAAPRRVLAQPRRVSQQVRAAALVVPLLLLLLLLALLQK
jgi:hypothetical protein